MTRVRGHKTELDPNDRQRTLFLQHSGCARFAYNWGLEQKIAARRNGEKTPSAMDLNKRLVVLKQTEFPWMYESSKCAPQQALRNLDHAFANFFRKCKQNKRGKKGFPRFKSRRNGVGSFYLQGAIRASETHITLPRIGEVRLKEHGYLPTADVKVLSATVSERAGRWFVSLLVETEKPAASGVKDIEHSVVGVDLGIKTLAVCSDGTEFANPHALKSKMRRLRRLQKSVSRKQKGSSNRRKAVAKVATLHWRIANTRRDVLHKLTTRLTRTKSAVVIEDLNVRGMLANRHLARAIADVGFGEFRRQLEYKGEWYGCQILVADSFYPSSKTCSDCGWINADLTLADREWVCAECRTVHDRDHNAALNLEHLAVSLTESLNACGEDGSDSNFGLSETDLDEAGTRQAVA